MSLISNNGLESENDSVDVDPSVSSFKSMSVVFEDEQRAFQAIDEIIQIRETNEEYRRNNDQALAELRNIFDKYLELPSLLDRCMPLMLTNFTDAARPLLLQLNSKALIEKRTTQTTIAKNSIHYFGSHHYHEYFLQFMHYQKFGERNEYKNSSRTKSMM